METVQRVCCPICMCELGMAGSQCIGALTFQGVRVEQALYHLGCVSSMLVHTGAVQSGGTIQWRPSPVTRKQVDGFLQMPWPSGGVQAWIKFVDWQGKGHLEVGDLAFVFSIMIKIDEEKSEDFIREQFGLENDNVISDTMFSNTILPYLEENCDELREAKAREQAKKWVSNEDITNLCIGDVCQRLEDHFAGKRLLGQSEIAECVRCFSEAPCTGNKRAISVIASMMCDPDAGIRRIAIHAHHKVIPKGDPDAIAIIWPHLQNECGLIRQAAIAALGAISIPESQQIVSTVKSHLSDPDEGVRTEVLHLLKKIPDAQPPGTEVMEKFRAMLEEESTGLRVTALRALAITSAQGDSWIIDKVTALTSDEDKIVRSSALAALNKFSRDKLENFIDILTRRAQDSCPKVRRVVTECVGNFGPEGDVECSILVLSLFSDPCSEVRLGALRAIRRLCVKGDDIVVKSLLPLLEDIDFPTRQCAHSVLAGVVERGDLRTTRLLRDKLIRSETESEVALRVDILKVLAKTVLNDDDISLDVISALMEDQCRCVRVAACDALTEISKDKSHNVHPSGIQQSATADECNQVNQVRGPLFKLFACACRHRSSRTEMQKKKR